jgi:hypothetical protein
VLSPSPRVTLPRMRYPRATVVFWCTLGIVLIGTVLGLLFGDAVPPHSHRFGSVVETPWNPIGM